VKPEDIPRDELFNLYKLALDEYRFEVRLNWDRTQYFLILNVAVLTAGLGLFKLTGDQPIGIYLAGVFVVGCALSIVGASAIRRGHGYYRRTVLKKTLIEKLLGFLVPIDALGYPDANVAIATTEGMIEATKMLNDWEGWVERRIRWDSVVWHVMTVLWLLAILNIVLVAYVVYVWMTGPQPRPPVLA